MHETPESVDARTIGIGRKVIPLPAEGTIHVDPPSSLPAKYGSSSSRYSLAPNICGLIERLARARYDIKELRPDLSEKWSKLEEQRELLREDPPSIELQLEDDIISPIAQSVWASTAIEGEEIAASDVPIALIKPLGQNQPDELSARMLGVRSVYAAYIWALTHPFPLQGGMTISPDFIIELHQRMFAQSKPQLAGKLKDKPNRIQWRGKVVLEMLPPDRVMEFLVSLCTRCDTQIKIAETSGRYSKLLAVAEFVVDFLAIHPFKDGNGRTARLLSTYLLERCGFHFARFYPLDAIIYERVADYYRSLFLAQQHWYTEAEDLNPWIDFYLSAVFTQWLRAHEKLMMAERGA